MKQSERWKKHKREWSSCDKCELCETRQSVVLFKGKIPCDILFIGEAPGQSEDVLGKPFVGPAGKFLDQMLSRSIPQGTRFGFTNLIACIPLDPNEGMKLKQPHKDHIKACTNRLVELFELTNPRLLVYIGKLAEKHAPKMLKSVIGDTPSVMIHHPAYILRADVTQRGLLAQQCEIWLHDAWEEVIPF